MRCPVCGERTRIIAQTKDCESVTRVRKCSKCGHKFGTTELETTYANERKPDCDYCGADLLVMVAKDGERGAKYYTDPQDARYCPMCGKKIGRKS